MHVDRRVAVRPVQLAPGRQPGDEGGRGDAQGVRRPRHDGARRGARRRPPTSTHRPTSRGACTSPTSPCTTSAPTPDLEVDLEPGVTSFVGRNGQGKTNIVEAIDYLSRLGLAPGRRRPAARAPRGRARRWSARPWSATSGGRCSRSRSTPASPTAPGSTGRQLPRARELLGLVRTVVFAPDDLALVKGDPTERRRFADDLLVLHQGARYAGTRADYDRVLKQRNSLLKTARVPRVARPRRRCPPWRSGTSAWPGSARRSWPPAHGWSRTSTRCWARPTRRWPAGRPATTRRSPTSRSFDGSSGRRLDR